MDLVSKITMIASVVLMGYNASQLVAGYALQCEKLDEFRDMAKMNGSHEGSLRVSNLALSFILSVGYVMLVVFSGLAPWIALVLAAKFALTLFFSDRELCLVLRGKDFNKFFYWIDKADSFLNLLFGLAVAVILVL